MQISTFQHLNYITTKQSLEYNKNNMNYELLLH